MKPEKDQPIDTVEFERLWEEISSLWRDVGWAEAGGYRSEEFTTTLRRLKEIKHRFFNQLVS